MVSHLDDQVRAMVGKAGGGMRSAASAPRGRVSHPNGRLPTAKGFAQMLRDSDIDDNPDDVIPQDGTTPMTSIYTAMDFPPYQYREYPKSIKLPDGTTKTVLSQREELDAIVEAPVVRDAATLERNALAEENARLQAQLAELMAKTDRPQGGVDKIVDTLREENTRLQMQSAEITAKTDRSVLGVDKMLDKLPDAPKKAK